MSAETKREIQLEIAHVLFIDIVGYSKLLINQQSELLRELNEIVSGTKQFREAEAEGKLIRLPTGDGMALVFRNKLEAPAHCALEISQALKNHPNIRLRMGVHSGPVNEVADVNQRANIAGAGINMAQRVMDCGDAGHILLSRRVAEDLEQYRQWQPCLHDLGECEVKHGVRLSVVNLYTDELGNPEVPGKFRKSKEIQATPPTIVSDAKPARRSRALIAALVIVAASAAAAGFYIYSHPYGSDARPFTAPEKSIAVLPFENLSDDTQNAYFADGMQDQILTDLAKVADLKVISRISVMQYKNTATRNLREIAQQLGVAHVLEGSVQRAEGKVRVNAQLINALTDAHEWAENYDRPVDDVFAIQSEIAKKIADKLQARLSLTEKTAIEQPPTNDIPAFDLYSHARTLLLEGTNPSLATDNVKQAIELLNHGISRAPDFFLAYYALADAHGQLYFMLGDHTPARLALANAAVQRAAQLRPDSGEAHLAIAAFRYRGYRDYDSARSELALAQKTLPNDPEIPYLASLIDRRRGRWEDSVRNGERSMELDPRNVLTMQQTALTYQYLRRYPQTTAVLDRALAVAPKNVLTRVQRASIDFHSRADLRPLRTTIGTIRAEDPSSAAAIADFWLHLSLDERNPDTASHAIIALGAHPFTEASVKFNSAFGEGLIAQIRRDKATAETHFAAARAQQAELVRAQPDDAPALCSLGMMDAMLGRKKDALSEGRRAIELLPVSQDALAGSEIAAFFAAICAWSGERELAFRQLETVTRIPAVFPSYGELRLQPFWDPLRGDPRFEKIVTSLAPKEANNNARR